MILIVKVSPPADSTDSMDSSVGGFFPLLPQRRSRFKMIQLIPFSKIHVLRDRFELFESL